MQQSAPRILTTTDHDRASAGLTYVYPVVSRRANGVSVGINLNTNNACNWRCIYCQVPGLQRGAAPAVDLALLRKELREFLERLLHGGFLAERVPEAARRLSDIALSGNGEPTSAKQFEQVIDLIAEVRREVGVQTDVKTVLITNGSLIQRPEVRVGVEKLRAISGEMWFKLDRASSAGMRLINGTRLGMKRVAENLEIAARACPTWLQTCLFALDGLPPTEQEQREYLGFVSARLAAGVPLRGVLLYGLARKSQQPEAARLSSLPPAWLEEFAARLRALGVPVRVTP
ncbi:MAG TPA: hypothetical protein VFB20_14150 [Burkholderiales bacterium]|nr:hypothetical protein [Burkholderiales bacterium]